jgi:nucleoid-associated protein YgaU
MNAEEFGKKMLLNLKITPTAREGYPIGLPFITMFNPENFTVQEEISYTCEPNPGSTGEAQKFKQAKARKFSIVFTLDGTGVNAPKEIPVVGQILLFREATTLVNGLIHKPNYLIVQWGTFICRCQLTSSSIEYNLFDHTGVPLRAKVTASFTEWTDNMFSAITSMLSSPDLTHLHKVTDGEILPVIVFKTYKDQRYYLQVARANKLKNFRKLLANTGLILPPIAG